MATRNVSLLQQQVSRVTRRLFFQKLFDTLTWCLSGALILSACWLLLQPLVLETTPPWLGWAVTGSLVGVGVVLALILAVLRLALQGQCGAFLSTNASTSRNGSPHH